MIVIICLSILSITLSIALSIAIGMCNAYEAQSIDLVMEAATLEAEIDRLTKEHSDLGASLAYMTISLTDAQDHIKILREQRLAQMTKAFMDRRSVPIIDCDIDKILRDAGGE